ncbi:IclR family transcriptional regulator [Nocardia jinanensis]|uniref:IclR family transcriptional regulator n=1 Tax=Nocardia jinanensis TaxID=382504 RepID=A0A917RX71_9NOCA|nr:IclR family transcriptional regulator [Nocardia jinanensis]GGL40169.1 IclR family transcriptional regulator [Nocardia jinanensis]
MTGQNEQGSGAIQSVLNALRILEHIGTLQPVGVSELSRQVGLPKSSVQRAVTTLDHAGWIRPAEGDRTQWQLTSAMLGISLKAFGEYSLRDYAETAMQELQRRTNETVHLVSLDGDSGLVLHRLDSSQPVRAFVPVGTRSPLHATASGQAMLASLPPERARWLLSESLTTYTENTVVDIESLLNRLDEVRARGYAINRAEWRAEVGSISSPILSVDGTAVAALTISIPLNRMSDDIIEKFGAWASELARSLGPVTTFR